VALFGRDTLIVSLQTLIVYPKFAAGALEVLAEYQATERDDYRDAEPGKILHELRYGELAHFKLIPHTPYYGTADATPVRYPVLARRKEHPLQGSDRQARLSGVEECRAIHKHSRRVKTLDCWCGPRPSHRGSAGRTAPPTARRWPAER
jgi:hypothetical protein